jgi:catecholate siderophore receptor
MQGWFRGVAVLALATAVATPAAAQWTDANWTEEEPITVIGQRPAYNQDSASSATRTDTPLRDVPQAVSVITDDLIEDQGMRSMADVVTYVPGVSMGQGEGHRDAPTLRGNSTTADFYVDGVRDDVQYYRDLYNAERIEVLKGPNAMIFGRGGGGGVINRVTAWADWTSARELALTAGSYDQRRASIDLGGAPSESLALRLNAFYEDTGSYRDHVELERFGANPTASLRLAPDTELRAGYEHFSDDRTVDRGVPSQNGRPYAGSRSAFFGNPELSYAETTVDLVNVTLTHAFSPNFSLRNHTLYADYDKFYQNVHANSPVNGAGDVTLQAYASGTERQNIFNQTDLIWDFTTGAIGHRLLTGVEFGAQRSDNTRVPNAAGGIVNIANPTTFAPVAFSPVLQTDNHVDVNLAAVFVQDQIRFSDQLQIVAGLRFDRFDLDFDDRRPANADFSRVDETVSPRLGVIYRPHEPLTLYASYSVSFLPQSGDQFSSLSATSSTLDPEEFENIELGLRWDVSDDLAFTAALYRLDRTNTTAIDPISSLTVLTGAQRSEGLELSLVGAISESWDIIAGYAYQDARISRTTSAAPAGRAAPLTPEHAFSLWNHIQLTPRFGFGLGVIHQGESFASISNAVTLPAFTRVDAALYLALTDNAELQLNVENLADETYWATAHNDDNITPASPTAARLTLRTRF